MGTGGTCPACGARAVVTWPAWPGLFGCFACCYRWRPPDLGPSKECAAALKRERENRAGRCEDHGYPLSLCPYGCSGLA